MKLKHIDPKVFAEEGVIERTAIDAREILRTGNYEQVFDDVEVPAPKKVELTDEEKAAKAEADKASKATKAAAKSTKSAKKS